MLAHYIKIAFRNLIKRKVYTLINISGLALALICAIFILLWVQYELSYDGYHNNADDICLAYLKSTQDGDVGYQSTVSPMIAGILEEEFPEVKAAVRVRNLAEVVFKVGDNKILETGGVGVDPDLFEMFSYRFIRGNPNTALDQPDAIVLTQSLAEKYFGNENPIGQSVQINHQFNFRVKAVIEDMPFNSHRRFNYFVPFSFLEKFGYQVKGSAFFPCSFLTYIHLRDNISVPELSDKIGNRINAESKVIKFEIALIPLTEIFIHENGGKEKLYIFSIIAAIILFIACLNFMNLSIAQATKRAKEIGIRKVSGARRLGVGLQIIGESTFMAVLAIIVAIIVVELFLPQFNFLTRRNISIDYLAANWLFLVIGIVAFTGIFAGLYPAIFLSSFQPVKVLKAAQTSWSNRSTFRKVSIILQFSISVIFMIATIVMTRQMNYIQNFDLGMNQNNIINVKMDGEICNRISQVKTELLKHPNIKVVSSASVTPVAIRSGSFRKWGAEDAVGRRNSEVYVDEDFLTTFDIGLTKGRFYGKQFGADANDAIIVNEALIAKLGEELEVGSPFFYENKYYNLVGVVKNFQNISPMYAPPQPITFFFREEGNRNLFVRIDDRVQHVSELTPTVNFIKQTCNKFSPDYPLQYSFVSDYNYEDEIIISARKMIILYSALIAIIISALGILGLSTFINEQRKKEIGIRKVNGATVVNLILLLVRDYLGWVAIANIIAWPVAYYIMKNWLAGFAYKVPIGLEYFIFAGFLAFLIAVLVSGIQAYSSATTNPVKSLKYE